MQTQVLHPTFSVADINAMPPREQLYFTDTPAAHIAAFEDFTRQTRLSALAVDFDTRRFARFIGAGE